MLKVPRLGGISIMGTSQRVSRGFQRLALFLAAIPLLVGAAWSLFLALDTAGKAQNWHNEEVALACAKDAFYRKFYSDMSRAEFERRLAAKVVVPIEAGEIKATVPDLKELGCWSGQSAFQF